MHDPEPNINPDRPLARRQIVLALGIVAILGMLVVVWILESGSLTRFFTERMRAAPPNVEPVARPAVPKPPPRVAAFEWRPLDVPVDLPWTAVADPDPKAVPDPKNPKLGDFPLGPGGYDWSKAKPIPGSRFLRVPVYRPLKDETRGEAVIDATTGESLGRFTSHRSETVFLNPGRKLIGRCRSDKLAVIDLAAETTISEIEDVERERPIVAGELVGDDKVLVIREFAREVQVLDWVKKSLLVSVRQSASKHCPFCATISPNGRYFVYLGNLKADTDPHGPNQLIAFDLGNGRVVGRIEMAATPKRIEPYESSQNIPHHWLALRFSADGQRIAGVRTDRVLFMWDWTSGKLLLQTPLDTREIYRKQAAPNVLTIYDENSPVLYGTERECDVFSPKTGSKFDVRRIDPLDYYNRTLHFIGPGIVQMLKTNQKTPTVRNFAVNTKANKVGP